jgi:hypothetical protein
MRERFHAKVILCCAAAFLISFAARGGAAESRDTSLEYAVKAAYLPKFANYVDWPASAFETSDSAVSLCIAGVDPFGPAGDSAIQNQRVGERRIVVRHLDQVTRDSGCQILFIGGDDQKLIAEALDAVRGTRVLTVTEAPASGGTPSIIRFVIDDKHVRFSIDTDAAAQNGLSLSSKLLRLSVTPPQQ